MDNIKIGENTYKWTMLYFKVFTLKALYLRHVSALCGPSSCGVHQYLCKK